MEELRYHYKVSLAVTHPSLPAQRISAALSLVPAHSGSVGAERRTPKNGPLSGLNRESFWRHSFVVPSDDDLEQFLDLTVAQLEAASSFFNDLIAAGGHARLFIGLFLEQENIGIELSPDLQARCSQLGISLGFDIYGPNKPDGAA
jgi:hypothetical protein